MKTINIHCILYAFSMFLFSSGISIAQLPYNKSSQKTIEQDEPNDGVIKKGTKIVGTFFNFGNTYNTTNLINNVKTGTQSLTLGGNVTGGYMISNRIAAIINIGVSSVKTTNFDEKTLLSGDAVNQDINKINYTFTGSLRYYKLVSEGNYFFMQLSGQYVFGSETRNETDIVKNTQISSYSYNNTGGGLSLNPGFTSFISRKLAAEISIGVLGYTLITGADKRGDVTTNGGFQFLLYQNSVNLGFVYYF